MIYLHVKDKCSTGEEHTGGGGGGGEGHLISNVNENAAVAAL